MVVVDLMLLEWGRYYSRELFVNCEPPECLHVRGVKVSKVSKIVPGGIQDDANKALDLSESFQLAYTLAINGRYPSARHSI